MNIEALYILYTNNRTVSTDTRNITPGSLFFSLKGENFNGNEYAAKALEAGASYAVIDDSRYYKNNRYILVQDTLKTLQELAMYHRAQLTIPIIGITGTNGKTTTKELLNAVLSQHYVTYCTTGNLNNHIGVPLTLLAIQPDVEIAIVEMGANHKKEIEGLCAIAQPTHGLITNVGRAHLEGFGGFEGVKEAKGELYDFIKSSKGIIFVDGDNLLLKEMYLSRGIDQAVRYGQGKENEVSGSILSNDPLLTIEWLSHTERRQLKTNLTGSYNLENILAAVTIGLYFSVPADEIDLAISSYTPGNNRSQIIKTAINTLICDYYNANPSSMRVAIDNLNLVHASKKVLILGDMFELGANSLEEHQQVVNHALSIPVERRIFIGKEFDALKTDIQAEFYSDVDSAMNGLSDNPIKDAMILIKGSRGMKMEKLVPIL
ncbi:UDP-N-acetylmuramoyl-tripeptide--D-alanyl-D-alanine ligase [Arcticibacter eurypsychrophilus]|uniref:UDP-N-acetylmuramoyl-tripeptide--D-alanyl-D- alanine ligase n=1 Tax=Arcticibacter eurypsychrophilus TaxID=1434752 RepID=UPI00084D99E9|nr:UDP-N-acetylmuramoyl-tripeptide--D-alanyl-D-alanine ligase [Arcticibacter eurypsychrophilus]